MRTCISTYSYSELYKNGDFTRHDAIEQTKKFGMDAVELQLKEGYEPEGMTLAAFAKELANHAREIGLDVPIYTVGANFSRENPEEEAERIMMHIDIAAECGIHLLRHDSATVFVGDEAARTPQTVIERVAPYIRRVAEYGESKGVKTCTENHGRLIQDSYRMELLINAVNHKNYGWLCDMGNFGGVDENCAEAASRLLPSVCFVHAKDWFYRSGMTYDPGRGFSRTRGGAYRRATIFGHGDVPTYQILSALNLAKYKGYVSLEFEGIEENLLALEIGSENLKRMLVDLDATDFDTKWLGN